MKNSKILDLAVNDKHVSVSCNEGIVLTQNTIFNIPCDVFSTKIKFQVINKDDVKFLFKTFKDCSEVVKADVKLGKETLRLAGFISNLNIKDAGEYFTCNGILQMVLVEKV